MNSMRTKVTLLAVCAMIVSLGIIAFVGAVSVKNLSNRDADRTLQAGWIWKPILTAWSIL